MVLQNSPVISNLSVTPFSMPAVKRKRSGDSTLSPAPVSPDLGAEEGKLEPKTRTGAEASLMGLEQYRLPLYPGEVYYIPEVSPSASSLTPVSLHYRSKWSIRHSVRFGHMGTSDPSSLRQASTSVPRLDSVRDSTGRGDEVLWHSEYDQLTHAACAR